MYLTKQIAEKIIDYYYDKECPTNEDLQAAIDARLFLVENCNDYNCYNWLGGYYYEIKRFDLALKYYLLGDAHDQYSSSSGLGYIYYYGRTGEVDYKKAMHYFSRAYEHGDNECGIKIADMYHNGYGVEKDEKKYRETLIKIYSKYKVIKFVSDPVPELASRLGQIYLDEGCTIKARNIIHKGLSVIEQRLRFNTFWGNLIIAKRLINLYHRIVPLNIGHLTFIDLFYYFNEPNVAVLRYGNRKYFIEAFVENNNIRVKCDGKTYGSVEDFYSGCVIGRHHINVIETEYNFDLVTLEFENRFLSELENYERKN